MSKEKNRKNKKVINSIKTTLSAIFTVIIIVLMVLANTLLQESDRMINNITGAKYFDIDNANAETEGLDLEYNKSDYTAEEIKGAEIDLNMRIAGEGTVLLKNEDNLMPFEQGTDFSFFSVNSKNIATGAFIAGGDIKDSIKTSFESKGFTVNDELWEHYATLSDYGLGPGSISYGDDEDFSINEAPLSTLEEKDGLLDSAEGTVPVFVLKRVAGEGRDMPRSMYNHTDIAEDKEKSYLEPDSVELEVLEYLNENFEDVVLLVNSNAALELDWVDQFPSIKSVVYVTTVGNYGMDALADVFAGNINPSGRTVDTFAASTLDSPAAQNFGSYQYYDEKGNPTKYNYVSYKEGIYVGYKYYETRYEDVVLNQGNAGDYDYAEEVVYPFGYGLSYTDFEWSDYTVNWNGDEATVEVEVTNTGEVAGKDVVQIYAQSPYTDYDKENAVEKSSVTLVGYTKTQELLPGESEIVTVTFDEEQLKSYDAENAGTYILSPGDYFITAGKNSHDAINNILTTKGNSESDGMTAEGNEELVAVYTPDNEDVDAETYAKDTYSDAEVTNLFDDAKGDFVYLTRNDWEGTFPTSDGEVSDEISTWGNEINGVDGEGSPAPFTYYKTIDEEAIAQLDSFDSLSPVNPASISAEIIYGEQNDLSLINMRGLDFDDPQWDELLNQLTEEEYFDLIAQSGYGTPEIESINKPFAMDGDTASGLIYGGTGRMMFPNSMMLAQTWNVNLAYEYGEMIGNEAILGGLSGWYAPSMNIHRTPYSGRNGEYYSEDGYLSGVVGAASTYGAASKGLYTFIKHYAINDQENHRGDRTGQYGLATWANEQSIREIYLKPFEMSLKSGDIDLNYVQENEDGTFENTSRSYPAGQAVMSAFNRLGYTWTGGHYPLITGILRNEWDFDGFVITDNANTGEFMDGYQMIEAGADGKLTYAPGSARFDFEPDNPAHYKYGRDAMHRMLYTLANSKLMNGAMPGSKFVDVENGELLLTETVQLGVNIVGPILIALMGYFTYRRHFNKSKVAENKK